MSVLFIVLPLALILAGLALWAFIRAVSAGQFDDLDTPAHRILHDDHPTQPKPAPPPPASPKSGPKVGPPPGA